MGITKTFFNSPIVVPMTFRRTVRDGDEFKDEDSLVVFTMNRESVGSQNGAAVATSLFNDGDNYERFCNLLAVEPEGIDDFPRDETPLKDRARLYFASPHYRDLIQYVVMEVERASKPLELFRGV